MLCHAVTLTFDLLTLNFYGLSGVLCLNSVQIWVKSNNPRMNYWWFSTFSHAILGGGVGQNWQGCVDPTSPNLARTYGDHRSIALSFQISDILLHFQTRAAQSWVMFQTTPNFALFDPWGGVGEISLPIVEALPTLEHPIHLMAIHCTAAERDGLIKTKKKFMGKT